MVIFHSYVKLPEGIPKYPKTVNKKGHGIWGWGYWMILGWSTEGEFQRNAQGLFQALGGRS